MNEYLPSFIVEPVLRQARRFSERAGGEEQPSATDLGSGSRFTLPTVSAVDFQRFNPSRFWNQSSSPSAVYERSEIEVIHGGRIGLPGVDIGHEDVTAEPQETTLQSIARNVQLWAAQINNLDVFPSPPLNPIPIHASAETISGRALDDARHEDVLETLDFPALESLQDTSTPAVEMLESQPTPTPQLQPQPQRTDSETSLNPAHELSYRAQVTENHVSGRSHSDPLVAPNMGEARLNAITGEGYGQNDYNRMRDGSGTLPEDDGMGPLRQRIHAIWAGPGTAQEKSSLVHTLMQERHRQSRAPASASVSGLLSPSRRAVSPSTASIVSQQTVFHLSHADLEPTFAPVDQSVSPDDIDLDPEASKLDLGCIHYRRNVKMQCAACEQWYTCRLCHDEVEDHVLPRRDTKHMLCMVCNTPQGASQACKMCGTQAACYYCDICKLWNNDSEKSIYHCDDCGICRLGEGLGKDFFHCKTCAACMSIQAESTHRCIERSTKCDCPICGEYMFTSNKPVAFMRCGHGIHESCFADWCNTSYKCPICSKSIANMESQFRRLDRHIESQPMPEEYRNNRAYVFCNDCNSRSITKYHWLGLKCTVCDSYNTAQLELLGAESPAIQEQADRALEMGVGEASITASQSQTPTDELMSPALDSQTNISGIRTPVSTIESRPATRDSAAIDIVRSPPLRRDSPFHHLPHSPSRPVRAASPVVGSYFGTGQARPGSDNRRGSYFSVFSVGSAPQTDEGVMPDRSAGPLPQQRPRSLSRLQHEIGPSVGNSVGYALQNVAETVNPVHPTVESETSAALRSTVTSDGDEDMDFWGGQSPKSYEAELVDLARADEMSGAEDGSESEDDEENYEMMNEDSEDEDEDLMDLFGHR